MESPAKDQGPSPTVSVVDDDPAVRKSLSRLLRSAGLTVATYASAREFLDHPEPHGPGCAVLDVAMPELSGLELQKILAMRGQETQIIFLTGNGDIPMSVQAIKRGAVD